jgi:hypothetical protein
MISPKCYSCGKPILKITQRVENETTFIDFWHLYGNSCIDIIDIDYFNNKQSERYFTYIRNLISNLECLETPKTE